MALAVLPQEDPCRQAEARCMSSGLVYRLGLLVEGVDHGMSLERQKLCS
jgi:hypothetical protein